MAGKSVVVHHKVGLHARPAALFVQMAAKFTSEIEVSCNGRAVNAKSILSVLTLGAHQGTTISITAEGDDAQEAVEALVELVETNFGEQA